MDFSILNWNIGGAKYLETKRSEDRARFRERVNNALRTILEKPGLGGKPEVVTLQEIVRYQEPDWQEPRDLIDDIEGYKYFPFTLIDTRLVSSRAKWRKVLANSDWPPDTYFAQGNGFLFREDSPIFPVWDLSNLDHHPPGKEEQHFVEHIHLESGLYFGDRNTEPRAALVAHFIYDPSSTSTKPGLPRKPLDVFVVNLHLTTLMMEREGVPEIDRRASRIRQTQLDIIFDGIVSRYNSWRRGRYPQRGEKVEPETWEAFDRYSPVWILAGDFNFTPESEEYTFIRRMNFVDTIRADNRMTQYGAGTKARGVEQDPTVTLDYVFAGPMFVSFDPVIEQKGLGQNRVIHDHHVRASDHYPLAVRISFEPVIES